jgi:hypothetical protein
MSKCTSIECDTGFFYSQFLGDLTMKKMKPTQFAIYTVLQRHPKNADGTVTMSKEEMMQFVQVNARAINYNLVKMKEAGLIQIIPTLGGSNSYVLKGE